MEKEKRETTFSPGRQETGGGKKNIHHITQPPNPMHILVSYCIKMAAKKSREKLKQQHSKSTINNPISLVREGSLKLPVYTLGDV